MESAIKKLVLIGEVVRTQGIKGKLKVRPLADLDTFLSIKYVYLGKNEDDTVNYKVASSQLHKGIILGLEGIKTMSQAETLIGSRIFAEKEALEKLPEGEYYRFEIIGLEVMTEGGRHIGKIEEIFPAGSNDIYVVRDSTKEYLIPAIEEFVKEIDIAGGRMVISPIEGLLGEK